jgi:hypothetical protein
MARILEQSDWPAEQCGVARSTVYAAIREMERVI